MTNIEDLAQTVAEAHGIDSRDAAQTVVRVFVDQIADDPDLYNPATRELTTEGAEVISAAIAHSYAQGFHATEAAQMLEDLATEAAAIAHHERAAREHTVVRDDLVRAALKTELRRADIAAAAGVKEARLYQIRDRRR